MIPLLDLTAQYHSIQPEIDEAIHRVLESGHFILGPNVAALEQEVAGYLGVKHGIGVASGTDALVIALRAVGVGPGDEVIVPAYTFFATAGTVMTVGARPVFVDVYPNTYCLNVEQVSERITPQTKAIVPVHLYGHPAEMTALLELARKNDLRVIEDNAQAFGAEYHGRKTGSLGDLGCLSFFPTKNLGAYGDAGMIVTDDDDLAARARMLRAHGWKKKYFPEMLGYNSRLDELQAAILRVKLNHLTQWNERRREIARQYTRSLASLVQAVPVEMPDTKHVYHQYTVRLSGRDHIQGQLKSLGIASDVYYPQPPHLADPCRALGYQTGDFVEAERASRQVLSLPLYPEMADEQVGMVIETLRGLLEIQPV